MKQDDVTRSAAEEMSLGELKAIQRESHLCLRCTHQAVCKIACAIDQEMLVIISQCMVFESATPPGGEA